MSIQPTVQPAAIDPARNWHRTVFFGVHYDLHAKATDTELGAALTHDYLRAELQRISPDWVQCDCKGVPGYSSWPTEVGSASPGIVNDALRIHRDVTRELGIPLVMHYAGMWDDRAIELHPDWAWQGPRDVSLNKEGWISGRTCNLSPYTEELMIPHMLEIIDKYDVDGFWVDGENWAVAPCYCPRCLEAFQVQTGWEAPAEPNDPHWRAWADFHREAFKEHVRKYTAAVHARKPGCLVCSNWLFTQAQAEEIDVPVDFISGDYSWVWGLAKVNYESRFTSNRGMTWDLMCWAFTTAEDEMKGFTFKPLAHMCQEAAVTIAQGGAFQLYNVPQRSGYLTGWHQDALAGVGRFVRARKEWCMDTTSVPQVAVLNSAEHIYRHTGDMLNPVGTNNNPGMYGAVDALLENHCHVDVLNEATLQRRLAEFPLVVIPEQDGLTDELKTALAEYVQQGGVLWLSGPTVAAEFADLTGAQPAGDMKEDYAYLAIDGEATTVRGPWQPVAVTSAEVVRELMDQQEPGRNETGEAVVTRRWYGAGQVLAIHGAFFAHYAATHYPRTRRLVGEWLRLTEPKLMVEVDAPSYVHLSLRRQPGRLIAHLVNLGCAHPTSPTQVVVEEVPPVGPVTLTLRLPEKPSRLYLAPSMEGLTSTWKDGLLTVRIAHVGIMETLVIEC